MATSSRHRAPVRPRLNDGDTALGTSAWHQRHELIAAAGGAMLLVVIAVLSGWAHYSLSNARPVLPHAATAAPATGVAEPLTSPRPGGQLRGWLAQAEPSINALIAARRAITAAAAADDIVATGAACESADVAVTGAQHHMPSPDPELNTALQQAIDSYRVGLGYCVRGVQTHDGTKIAHAARYIERGNVELQAALAIIDRDLPENQPRDPRVLTV